MTKGQQVTYKSGMGFLYSAVVQRAHRDGTVTLQLHFPLDSDGQELVGCFQGDVFRVVASVNVLEPKAKTGQDKSHDVANHG